ncbi:MAG: insulinase family protein [Rhodospirillales bacterium]|nr:insulinase family protein [Rhodospirillales bacterium]
MRNYANIRIGFFLFPFFLVSFCFSVAVFARDRFLDIKEVKTESGLSVWLVEDHRVPVISVDFAFRGAGASIDPQGKQGLAQLVSNTLDEGAGDLDAQAFQKTLRDLSVSLSFSSSRDHFYGTLKTLTRNRDRAADLMSLALTRPRFDAEAVERMRAANISRIKSSLTDPDWMAARIMNDVAFAGDPYARNSGGSLSTLATITPEDLRNFAGTYLGRDRLVIAITGDIKAADVPAFLDRLFGGLPPGAAMRGLPDVPIQGGGTVTVFPQDIPQSVLSIMQPGIKHTDPDYDAAVVMNFILGGSGFGSRLTEEIREKRGLTYGIYTGLLTMDRAQALTLSGSTENKNAGQVLDLIRAEWAKMREVPVAEKELMDAKSYLIGSMPLALSSTDAISGLLLGLRLDGLPIDYLDKKAEKVNSITVGDVARVSKKLLDPAALSVVLVGRPEGITATKTLEKLPDVE